MSWDIVFWDNKESVDYVPSIWAINEGTSYKWPIGVPVNLQQKLIQTCDPLIDVKFRICKGTAKMKGITSLFEAEKYCEKASYTSSLDTTDVEDCRNSVEQDISSADDDDGDLSMTKRFEFTAPTREHHNKFGSVSEDLLLRKKRKIIDDTVRCSSPRPAVSIGSRLYSSSSPSTVLGIEEAERSPARYRSSPKTAISTRAHVSSSFSPKTVIETGDVEESLTQSYCSSPRTVLNGNGTSSSNLQVSMTEAEKLIYKGIVGLQWEVSEINNQLKKRLNYLEENLLTGKVLHAPTNETWMLPLEDEHALNAIEQQISDDQSKSDNLIQRLYLCGGDTFHKAVYASMNKLISKRLAMCYSGEGRKGKLSFQKLKCYEAVKKAARRRFQEVTDKELNKSISSYLAGASDRQGGRKGRTSNN
ncbi:hypothetical protein FQR65_LT20007 [Abscondita terminalis]|nr:hypothetical protein FQR65_LT20007 [Abscondita terminalis]